MRPLSCASSGFIASFHLKSGCNIDGMHYLAHSLPFSMKTMVKVELKRLIAARIIYPVDNPMILAPIMPVVKQSGTSRPIRICGDYSLTLNHIIDRDSYTLLHLKEVLQKSEWRDSIFCARLGRCLSSNTPRHRQSAINLHINAPRTFCLHKNAVRHFGSSINFSTV